MTFRKLDYDPTPVDRYYWMSVEQNVWRANTIVDTYSMEYMDRMMCNL